MKLNLTVSLTFSLLILMFGAGLISGNWGFALGREALKGITQPDVRPKSNVGSRRGNPTGREEMSVIKEADILKKVEAITSGKGVKPEKNQEQAADKEQKSKDGNKSPESANKPALSVQESGITLAVAEVKKSDEYVTLNISLKNDGNKAVRFLYSLLEVKDDQGQILTAITEGLPGELPANGEAYTGTVKIPKGVLQKAKKVSVKLTDYPDQNLQLEVPAIPL